MSLGFLVIADSVGTKANPELLAKSCSAMGSRSERIRRLFTSPKPQMPWQGAHSRANVTDLMEGPSIHWRLDNIPTATPLKTYQAFNRNIQWSKRNAGVAVSYVPAWSGSLFYWHLSKERFDRMMMGK